MGAVKRAKVMFVLELTDLDRIKSKESLQFLQVGGRKSRIYIQLESRRQLPSPRRKGERALQRAGIQIHPMDLKGFSTCIRLPFPLQATAHQAIKYATHAIGLS